MMKRVCLWATALAVLAFVIAATTRTAHAFCAFNCSPDRKCAPGCPPNDPVPGTISANHQIVHFNQCQGSPYDSTATPANGCPETCDAHRNGDVPDGYFVVRSSTPGQAPSVTMPLQFLDEGLAAPPGFSFNDRMVSRTISGQKDSGKAGHHIGINEGRLRSDLRQVARAQEPLACALHLASIQYASSNAEDRVLGQAYADLAVTGRNAFGKFRSAPPTDANYCASLSRRAIPRELVDARGVRSGCPAARAPMPSEAALIAGCRQALARAYLVAKYLRTGQDVRVGLQGAGATWVDAHGLPSTIATQEHARKTRDRAALGWIAVSGEDDPPHRPVNAPSSDFPQYDIDVNNVAAPHGPAPKAIKVHTRYTVAQSRGPAAPARREDEWLSDPTPAIPGNDTEILIFVHGMDSRAEEANDITQELFKVHEKRGIRTNLVVIAVDLPSSGYAETIDHRRVSDTSVVGHDSGLGGVDYYFNGKTPLLDFIEQFIVDFVGAVNGKVSIESRIKSVLGGSLGGNMSFRLGRRPNTAWLPRAIVWSPASIWESLGRGADVLMHQGPRKALKDSVDFGDLSPNDLADLTPARLGRRRAFFEGWDQPIFQLLGIPLVPGLEVAQSDTWQSDYYLCKQSGIAGARLDRHETYDATFLRWRWRLGGEQLLFSHQTIDPATQMPNYMSNCKPMLLSCGLEDHVPYNDICPATMKTAPYMRQTPGRAIFFDKTGHSVDNERRAYFAQEIVKFLGERWVPNACHGPTKKHDGESCVLPDECTSNRCYIGKCQAPHSKHDGESCALPDECVSNRCYGFKCQAPHTKHDGESCAIGDECASSWCYGFKCQSKHTKANGSLCAIPDECASNRCIITCQAQPRLKNRGEGCGLPGECASNKCDFLEGFFKGLKCY